LFVKQ